MSYLTEIQKETNKTNAFIVSRYGVNYKGFTWSAIGGDGLYVLTTAVTNKILKDVYLKNTALTQYQTRDEVVDGGWYFDKNTNLLYVNINSEDPSDKWVILEFELYFSTQGVTWYSDPLDATSEVVYYEPIIISVPNFRAALTDSFLGYMPSETTSFSIANGDHLYENILWNCSFSKRTIKYYSWAGDLKLSNIQLIINGLSGDITYRFDKITFQITSRFEILNNNVLGKTYYSLSTYPNVKSDFLGRPIRELYGRVKNFYPVNVDYNSEAPTTSNNRIWVVGRSTLNQYSTTAYSSGNTTTRTFLNMDQYETYIQKNDNVKLVRNGVAYYRRVLVRATGGGHPYIDHDAIPTAMQTGEVVWRPMVSQVVIDPDSYPSPKFAIYDTDYTESQNGENIEITFTSGMEANQSISTLTGDNIIMCKCFGKINDVTYGGVAFGAAVEQRGPITAMLDLLKKAGVAEGDIDSTQFEYLRTQYDVSAYEDVKSINFANPKNVGDDFRTFGAIISEILTSVMMRLVINNSNKWTLVEVKKLYTLNGDYTISEKDFAIGSLVWDLKYSEILSDIYVSYDYKEHPSSKYSSWLSGYVHALSETAKYLHNINKQRTFEAVCDSDDCSSNLAILFGDRQGLVKLTCKLGLINASMDDVYNLETTNMLGYAGIVPKTRHPDEFQRNTRPMNAVEIDKTLNQVNITLFDNKGFQDS